MRKKRDTENPEARVKRVTRNAQAREDNRASNDAAVDAMVTKNIEQFGP